MAAVSIEVPGPVVEDLVETLLSLLEVKAEALRLDAEATLRDRGVHAPLLVHLAELRSAGELLDQVGWQRGPRERSLGLTGPFPLVREVVASALVTRFDRLVPGGVPSVEPDQLGALASGLDRLSALVALLRAVDAARPAAPDP